MTVRLPIVVPFSPSIDEAQAPEVPFSALDTVWFQLTGTLCNIACQHCFISCGPKENRVPMMTEATVRSYLSEAAELGVRDYYFTGGEPLLHPQFWTLAESVLAVGPLTVLSNGILIDGANAERARTLFDAARYSFDLRISLDGMSAEENDPVRGRGTFEAITRGIAELARVGLSPTITVVEHRTGMGSEQSRSQFLQFVVELGLSRPRVKFMPLLRIGREAERTHGYDSALAWYSPGPVEEALAERLLCSSSRLVTEHGVMICPILLDAPGAQLAKTLRQSMTPIALRWDACRTCVVDGLSCRT